METRANYALIGLFTLAILFGIFIFAYWFIAAGNQVARKTYKCISSARSMAWTRETPLCSTA